MTVMEKRSVEPLLPMTAAMFHVLLALADGDKHGYAIMKEVTRLTDGAVSLSAGTLYGILRRLESEGLVVEKEERPAPELDDERRRYYHLTEFGRRVARAEAERLEDMVELARSKKLMVKVKPI
ncbi:MAG TPA: PadR family transcriptional regulator [Candidatus Acidoferrales bacterium]|jgi:DNA-binding PadR family transcriptional regulator|nr:PadR family transcriptional regulator [Candidatus Acidoferrales bacterium]